MFFPVSGLDVHPLVPPLVAFGISFFTSMGGVSGAFILLPFQVSVLGYVSPSVSATNQLFNVVAIPGGVYRYIKESRMIWPLTGAVVAGTVPGVFAGALIRVRYLPDAAHFKAFVALVLLYIGFRMLRGLLRPRPSARLEPAAVSRPRIDDGQARAMDAGAEALTTTRFNLREIVYEYRGERHKAPTAAVTALSLAVGVVGGIYGIGGGAIVAPFFVAVLRLPVHTVAGATLMGTFVTSIFAVAFFQLIAPFYPDLSVAPDWTLGILFGIGGLAGTYLGARTQRFVPARTIEWILVVCLMFVVGKYLLEFAGAL